MFAAFHRRVTSLALCATSVWATLGWAEEASIPVPMEQRATGTYYVRGTLSGGVGTELLVDTGSGYVSLSKATFNRIRMQPGTQYLRAIVGTLANGQPLQVPVYRIAQLTLGESCVLTDVEVVVMPNTRRDILGLSALRRLEPFTLRLSNPALVVSGCGERFPTATAALH